MSDRFGLSDAAIRAQDFVVSVDRNLHGAEKKIQKSFV
jgi:hypothetical protein